MSKSVKASFITTMALCTIGLGYLAPSAQASTTAGAEANAATKNVHENSIMRDGMKLMPPNEIGMMPKHGKRMKPKEHFEQKISEDIASGKITEAQANILRNDMKNMESAMNTAMADDVVSTEEHEILHKQRKQLHTHMKEFGVGPTEEEKAQMKEKRAQHWEKNISTQVSKGKITEAQANILREDKQNIDNAMNKALSDGDISQAEHKAISTQRKQLNSHMKEFGMENTYPRKMHKGPKYLQK